MQKKKSNAAKSFTHKQMITSVALFNDIIALQVNAHQLCFHSVLFGFSLILCSLVLFFNGTFYVNTVVGVELTI